MAKDKYSSDHIIEVANGGTVTIKENLMVDGALTAGSISTTSGNQTVGGNLDVSGDLTVGGQATFDSDVDVAGNLNVTGDVTAGNITASSVTAGQYDYTTGRTIQRYVTVFDMKAGADLSQSLATTRALGASPGGYPVFTVGNASVGGWWIEFPIDQALVNGAKITRVLFLLDISAEDGLPSYSFDGSIRSYPSAGSSTTITVRDTDSFNLINFGVSLTPRGWYSINVDVDVDLDNVSGENIYMRLNQTSTGYCVVSIFKCIIEMTVTSVEMGLSDITADD